MAHFDFTKNSSGISLPNDGVVRLYASAEGDIRYLNSDNVNLSVPNGRLEYVNVTSNINIDNSFRNAFLDVTADNIQISSVPVADLLEGIIISIRNSTETIAVFQPSGPLQIDGLQYINISPNECLTFVSTPAGWKTLSKSSGLSSASASFISNVEFEEGVSVSSGDVTIANGDIILAGGVIKAPPGGAGNPSYTFDIDSTTGAYLKEVGTYAIAAAGTDSLIISSDFAKFLVPLDLPRGEETKPALYFDNNKTSGIYSAEADYSVAITANSRDVAYFTDYGIELRKLSNLYVGDTANQRGQTRVGKIEFGAADTSTFVGADNRDSFAIGYNTQGSSTPQFIKGGTNAYNLKIDSSRGYVFEYSDGSAAADGDPLSWSQLFEVNENGIIYQGNTIYSDGGTVLNFGSIADIPLDPAEGTAYFATDTRTLYMFVGNPPQWEVASSQGIEISNGTTPPATPQVGDFWFDTDTLTLFIRVSDNNTDQWIDVTTSQVGSGSGSITFTTASIAPATPVVGDIWSNTGDDNIYIYDFNGTAFSWKSLTSGTVLTPAAAPPTANVEVGDLWHDTATDTLYIYDFDGVTHAWRDITTTGDFLPANADGVLSNDGLGNISWEDRGQFSVWNTATRPASPTVGLTGYNTDIQKLEVWNGTEWDGAGGTEHTSNIIPPINPDLGDIWHNTSTGVVYIRDSDGVTESWRDITSVGDTLPADSTGILHNDGTGNISWKDERGIATWSMATRPNGSNLFIGQVGWNTDIGSHETWTGTEWNNIGGADFLPGATPPTSPEAGDLWHNTVDGALYVYDFDGTTYAWRDISTTGDFLPVDSKGFLFNDGTGNVSWEGRGTFDSWTTATRPTLAVIGQIGWNSDIGSHEVWNGTSWDNVGGAKYTTNATTPTVNVKVGDLWHDTSSGIIYVRDYDGVNEAWRDISSVGDTLPSDSEGLLYNDGAGNISWTSERGIASWATATRPTTPYTGQMGWNTDLAEHETWNGTTWTAASKANFSSSGTAPTNPENGDFWHNTNSNILYIYDSDGATQLWRDISSAGDTLPANAQGTLYNDGAGVISWLNERGISSWNTAGRPIGTDLYVGRIGWNTDLASHETWNGSAWTTVSGGSKYTAAATTPTVNVNVGDLWHDTSTSIVYIRDYDGTSEIWRDITSVGDTLPPNASGVLYNDGTGNISWNANAGGPQFTSSASAPISPSAGDFWHNTLNSILYFRDNDGVNEAWRDISSVGGSEFTAALTPPASASAGDLWHNSADNTIYMYDFDGTTGAWRDITTTGDFLPTNAKGILYNDGTGTISWDDKGTVESWNTASRPSSPTIGQLGWNTDLNAHETWSGSSWESVGGAEFNTAATAPASPDIGDLWHDTDSGIIYVRDFDGVTAQWRDISSVGDTLPSDSEGILYNDGTGGIVWQERGLVKNWTTATRPSPATINQIGWNTDLGTHETWDGTAWVSLRRCNHTAATAAPASPKIGDFWHDTLSNKLFMYDSDGATAVWRDISSTGDFFPTNAKGVLYNDGAGNTAFIRQGLLESWADIGRPSTPSAGEIGWNTDRTELEVYNGSSWKPIGGGVENHFAQSTISSITAVSGNEIWVDSSASPITITLPATPNVGTIIYVYRVGANNVTIDGNGNNISSSANFVLSADNTGAKCTYILGEWKVVAQTIL